MPPGTKSTDGTSNRHLKQCSATSHASCASSSAASSPSCSLTDRPARNSLVVWRHRCPHHRLRPHHLHLHRLHPRQPEPSRVCSFRRETPPRSMPSSWLPSLSPGCRFLRSTAHPNACSSLARLRRHNPRRARRRCGWVARASRRTRPAAAACARPHAAGRAGGTNATVVSGAERSGGLRNTGIAGAGPEIRCDRGAAGAGPARDASTGGCTGLTRARGAGSRTAHASA